MEDRTSNAATTTNDPPNERKPTRHQQRTHMKSEPDVAWAKTPIAAPELLGCERCEHLKPADRTVLRRRCRYDRPWNMERRNMARDVPAPASLAVDLQRARRQRAISLGFAMDLAPCFGVAHERDEPRERAGTRHASCGTPHRAVGPPPQNEKPNHALCMCHTPCTKLRVARKRADCLDLKVARALRNR